MTTKTVTIPEDKKMEISTELTGESLKHRKFHWTGIIFTLICLALIIVVIIYLGWSVNVFSNVKNGKEVTLATSKKLYGLGVAALVLICIVVVCLLFMVIYHSSRLRTKP